MKSLHYSQENLANYLYFLTAWIFAIIILILISQGALKA